MVNFRKLAAGLLAGTLVMTAAACSRDDDSAEKSKTDNLDNNAAEVTIPPAKDFDLDKPVKIIALISDPTVSSDPNATPEFNDGARMAIEEINDAGGIGGHPVEFVALETAPVGDGALDAFNKAVDQSPTAIVGPISSSAALAMAPKVTDAKIPVLQNTTEPQLALGEKSASEWMFGTRALNDVAAKVAGQFAVEELDAAKVGILSVSSSFGTVGAAAIKAGVTDAGGKVDAERSFEFNATELTEPVLAMKDSDVIIDWGTPNTLALSITTLNQQGLGDIKHIGPGSVGFPSFAKSVGDDALLDSVYGAVDCNPVDDQRATTKAWVKRFEQKYGYDANYASAQLYDSIYILREVIEKAESSDAAAIKSGLESLDWSGGVCAKRYTNKDNVLFHQTTMVKFDKGELKTIKDYEGI